MDAFVLPWMHWLVLLSIAISSIGGIAYIHDMIAGKTKPNLVSWSLWALAPLIATGAAISAGADPWGTARVFISGFVPFSIFIFGLFIRQSYWKLGYFDYFCGALSLVALGAWLLADQPIVAIMLAVLADLLATVPTIVKAWRSPETETALVFLMGLISSIITIPAIPIFNLENFTFQAYLIFINLLLFIIVAWGNFIRTLFLGAERKRVTSDLFR